MRAAPSRGRDDVEGQRKFLRTERGIPKDFARIFDAISVDPRDVDFQHEIQSLAADLSVDLSALPRKEFEKRIALQYQKMEVIHDRRALLKKRGEACGALACCDELWRHPTLIEIGNAKKYSKSLLFQLPFQHHPYGVLLNKALISLSSAFEKKLTSKELSQEWKQLWKDFQRTAFTMTQEFQRVDRDVCLYGRQVEWLSGSTSASFVPIFCMAIWGAPSLFPTGQLVQRNIPPFSGELCGGIEVNGVNLRYLSGVFPQCRSKAVAYAKQKRPFDAQREIDWLMSLDSTSCTRLLRRKIAALRLTMMDDGKGCFGAIIQHLRSVMLDVPESISPRGDWQKYIPLLGKSVALENCPNYPPIVPGSVVAVLMPDGPVFGLVMRSCLMHAVLYGSSNSWGEFRDYSLIPISEALLGDLVKKAPLPSTEEREWVSRFMALGRRNIMSDTTAEDDLFLQYISLVGTAVPGELLPQIPVPVPGSVIAIPTDERNVYCLVTKIEARQITVVHKKGVTSVLPLNLLPRFLSFTDQFLEDEIRRNPAIFDTEMVQESVRHLFRSDRDVIEEIIQILENQRPLSLTDQERDFIGNPISVVWGSLTKKPESFSRGCDGEAILSGRQELGRDIQLLFTEDDRIDAVREYVETHLPGHVKIHVLSLSVLANGALTL